MTRKNSLIIALLTALLVVGMVAPVAAAADSGVDTEPVNARDTERLLPATAAAAMTANASTGNATNNGSVNVTVGQQLSTVVAATGTEIQSEFENTAFEVAFESADERAQAETIANRAVELRERAADIREDYREATEAHREGELSRSQYAQRLAALNARAENLHRSYQMLRGRAENVSALELRAAGFNRTAVKQSIQQLDTVSGAGPSALLERYTGQTQGEIEIETTNGLSVEVQNKEGERSLEVERPRDANKSITVGQSVALQTARSELTSAPGNGTWTLKESSVHADSGYYRFEFALRSANATGEATVRVDGSSGEVFRLEQEIEQRERRTENEREDRGRNGSDDEGDDEGDNEDEDDELALLVASGTPAPGEPITVKALSAGEPAADVTVYVDERAVGTTGADGTASVTLPTTSTTVRAVSGDEDAELEFEFEEREEDVYRNLRVSGRENNGTVTVSVSYGGAAVRNATVYATGERVGTTGADGTVTFATTASEVLDVAVVKGEFEAEVGFAMSDGSLNVTKEPHERETETERKEDDEDADSKKEENEEESQDSGEDDSSDDSEDREKDDDEDGTVDSNEDAELSPDEEET